MLDPFLAKQFRDWTSTGQARLCRHYLIHRQWVSLLFRYLFTVAHSIGTRCHVYPPWCPFQSLVVIWMAVSSVCSLVARNSSQMKGSFLFNQVDCGPIIRNRVSFIWDAMMSNPLNSNSPAPARIQLDFTINIIKISVRYRPFASSSKGRELWFGLRDFRKFSHGCPSAYMYATIPERKENWCERNKENVVAALLFKYVNLSHNSFALSFQLTPNRFWFSSAMVVYPEWRPIMKPTKGFLERDLLEVSDDPHSWFDILKALLPGCFLSWGIQTRLHCTQYRNFLLAVDYI